MRAAIVVFAIVFPAQQAYSCEAAGKWAGHFSCSDGRGSINLSISGSGAVTGTVGNVMITSGRVSGRSIQFSGTSWTGSAAAASGTISGETMRGRFTVTVGQQNCSWEASQMAGVGVFTSQSANPGEDPEPDYSKLDAKKKRAAREKDAQSFLTAGAAAARYCTYTDQMVAAGRFSQAAEAFRLMGDSVRSVKADRLAKTASARADVCQRKQRAARAAPARKANEVAKAQPKDVARKCRDLADYQKKLEKAGQTELALKVRLQAKLKLKCR